MGFEVGGSTARLEFAEGTSLAGATVRVSLDMSVRDFLGLQRLIAGMSSDIAELGPETLDRWESAYTLFGKGALLSWDLTKDGNSIPATVEGFLSLPFAAANEIFTAWAKALAGPPPNSVAASTNGVPLEAEPVLMGQL